MKLVDEKVKKLESDIKDIDTETEKLTKNMQNHKYIIHSILVHDGVAGILTFIIFNNINK